MKLPPHILKAPLTYLDDNMVTAFRRQGFGYLPLWTSQGCALFVHIDTRTIKACRYAVHDAKLELHEVDGSRNGLCSIGTKRGLSMSAPPGSTGTRRTANRRSRS